MTDTFVKRRRDAPLDFYAAEAAGLRWLAAGGMSTVRVLEVDRTHISLVRLQPGRPTSTAARTFGRQLARLHDSGARRFGCAPEGFDGQLFIGNRSMSSVEYDTWGAFYAAERVLPYLRIAVDAGNVTSEEAALVESACGMVADGAFDTPEPASRLHGDLWSGNVMWTPDGVVVVDPAAHGGHRETDLAMLALFGCPHLGDVIDGYREAHDLDDGWRDRVPLHQLHPLAVHAAGHGRSYGLALADAARATMRLR
ncbi:MAG: fructosamine kinase family protein [Rhodococcus sp. (in: high G+C Gram-positive bacteria)]